MIINAQTTNYHCASANYSCSKITWAFVMDGVEESVYSTICTICWIYASFTIFHIILAIITFLKRTWIESVRNAVNDAKCLKFAHCSTTTDCADHIHRSWARCIIKHDWFCRCINISLYPIKSDGTVTAHCWTIKTRNRKICAGLWGQSTIRKSRVILSYFNWVDGKRWMMNQKSIFVDNNCNDRALIKLWTRFNCCSHVELSVSRDKCSRWRCNNSCSSIWLIWIEKAKKYSNFKVCICENYSRNESKSFLVCSRSPWVTIDDGRCEVWI